VIRWMFTPIHISRSPPLCHPHPYRRYLQQSKPRCAPYSAAHGMALCWRSISSCSVLRAETPQRLPPLCCAHAPACPVSCARIARGVSASVLTKKGSAPSLCRRAACCLDSRAPAGPCAKEPHGPMAGVAPAGVVPPSRRRSRPNTASQCQRKPYAAGSTRWAGCGNGPSGWPKMTTRTGARIWRVFGFRAKRGLHMR
jgi:hypothetical protein